MALNLKSDLQNLIKGEIQDDQQTLENYSKDAGIYEIQPQVVVFPKDEEDIKQLVKFVNNHPNEHLSITARSAGTDMGGGAVNDSIIISLTKYFNQVKKIGEDYCITQPGVFYRDFEPQTLKHHLLLPCYTASREINTVGGMVANNSAGEKTLAYGQTQNYIAELKVILSDGNEYTIKPLNKTELNKKLQQKDFEGGIYQKIYNLTTTNSDLIQSAKPNVSKNSAGYLLWEVMKEDGIFDLTKLFVGSQGTLGIITEIKFKLIKPKKHSNLLVIYLHNLTNLGEIINTILSHKPESLESYDDQTLKVVAKFLPDVLSVMKPNNLVKLAWDFIPEALMTLVGGFPKLIILAEFTGDSEEDVAQVIEQTKQDLSPLKLQMRSTADEQEARKYWTMRRESFSLLRKHSEHMRTAPFIDDFIVKPEYLPEFLPKLQKIMKKYRKDLIYTIAGHIGNGNFHIIPLMDFTKDRTKTVIKELSQKVYDLVFEYKGSMAGEHNDGLVRGPFLKQMYGEKVYELFKEIKKIFDPNDIFNPHKKTDATFEYSLAHLSHPHPEVEHGS